MGANDGCLPSQAPVICAPGATDSTVRRVERESLRHDESVDPTGDGFRLATSRERVTAYVVDAVAVLGGLLAVTRGWSRTRRLVALVVGSLVGATGYHVLFEGATGQTVGKRVVGITVVGVNGDPCSFRAAAVRTVARAVDWLPAGYFLGFLSMSVTERRQRLGDVVGGTVVVADDRES